MTQYYYYEPIYNRIYDSNKQPIGDYELIKNPTLKPIENPIYNIIIHDILQHHTPNDATHQDDYCLIYLTNQIITMYTESLAIVTTKNESIPTIYIPYEEYTTQKLYKALH